MWRAAYSDNPENGKENSKIGVANVWALERASLGGKTARAVTLLSYCLRVS